MQNTRHKYQDTSRKTQVSRRETRDTSQMSNSLVSISLISKTPSLCNIPVTPNKKGDCCNSHHPRQLRIYPQVLQTASGKAGESILVILFFLITKTLQMYVFI